MIITGFACFLLCLSFENDIRFTSLQGVCLEMDTIWYWLNRFIKWFKYSLMKFDIDMKASKDLDISWHILILQILSIRRWDATPVQGLPALGRSPKRRTVRSGKNPFQGRHWQWKMPALNGGLQLTISSRNIFFFQWLIFNPEDGWFSQNLVSFWMADSRA
jgi:hypothetical protein